MELPSQWRAFASPLATLPAPDVVVEVVGGAEGLTLHNRGTTARVIKPGQPLYEFTVAAPCTDFRLWRYIQ